MNSIDRILYGKTPSHSFAEFVEAWASAQDFGPLLNPQRIMCDWFADTVSDRRLLLTFRVAGKTTLAVLYAVWRKINDPEYSCFFISNSPRLSDRNLAFFRSIIEEHPFIERAFEYHYINGTFWLDAAPDAHVRFGAINKKWVGAHPNEIILDAVDWPSHSPSLPLIDVVAELESLADRITVIGTPNPNTTLYDELAKTYRTKCVEVR